MLNRSRQHWLAVSAALIVVVAATVTSAVLSTRAANAGTEARRGGMNSGPPTSSGTSKRELQFGIDYSDTLPFETPAQLGTSLDDAKTVGAQWIRIDLAWEDYQPFANFAPNFAKFDKVVSAANARGLKILATIGFPPTWARKAGCTKTAACPPASTTAFAHFAHQAAARYAPLGLHDWEIWNEPNVAAWAPAPDPAAYTALLTATASSIRQADTQAYLLLGGLAAGSPGAGAPYISGYDFLTAVGQHGGLKSVNAVGYHPYPDGDTIATSKSFQAISSTPRNLAEALAEQGAANLPIWITETGYDIVTILADPANHAKIQAEVQTQSRIAAGLIPVLDANQHVATMFWFADKDVEATHLYFGLRATDGTARPSLASLQKAITAYRGQFPQAK